MQVPAVYINMARLRVVSISFLIAVVLFVTPCALGKKRAPKVRRELIMEEGPSEDQIWDSGLLNAAPPAATLYERMRTYYHDTSIKKFQGTVLGYVTPWHKRGYDFAVRFRHKLTHVAPVWYQLKTEGKEGSKRWLLQGTHEVNRTWIDALRLPLDQAGSPVVRVVPRVIVELTDTQDHVNMVATPEGQRGAIEAICSEIQDQDLDGIVLEVWTVWHQINGLANDQFQRSAMAFVNNLGHALHKQTGRRRELILAVPPMVPGRPGYPNTDKHLVQQVKESVDGWSVMTYDYAVGPGAAPNAPLSWLRNNIRLWGEAAGKTHTASGLMGMNFYGYDYNQRTSRPEAIISDGYLQLLNKHRPSLMWQEGEGGEELAEAAFEYTASDGATHVVLYPTPRSLQLRLQECEASGVGISIWELGQGLERFFDLL